MPSIILFGSAAARAWGNRAVAAAAVDSDPYFSSVSLLLHADGTNASTTFYDSSVYANTVTSVSGVSITDTGTKFGSGSANITSGSYLTVPDSSLFDLGGTDFTIECWAYHTGISTNQQLITKRASGSVFGSFSLSSDTAGKPGFLGSTDGSTWGINIQGAAAITINTWHHWAATRTGNIYRLFVDGSQVGTVTVAGSLVVNTSPVAIGCNIGGLLPFVGKLDDIRITKGISRYTANFSVPTAAFPNTLPADPYYSSVALWLRADGTNASTTFIDSSPTPKTITAYGSSQISTARYVAGMSSLYLNGTADPVLLLMHMDTTTLSDEKNMPVTNVGAVRSATQSKFGGYSAYFAGAEYIAFAAGTTWSTYTGNFTIDFWLYPTVIGSSVIRRYFSIEDANNAIVIREESNVIKAYFRFGSATLYTITGSAAPTLNTWQHIALVRNSTTFTLYKNGTSIGTLTNAGSITASSIVPTIGGTNTAERMTGYIDEFRFTKTAEWTTTFTPPVTAYTATDTTTYLQAAADTAFNLTSDFTIESWVNFTVLPTSGIYAGVITKNWDQPDGNNNFFFGITNQAGVYLVQLYYGTINGQTTAVAQQAFHTLPLNSWVHLAAVKYSGIITIYANGAGGTQLSAPAFFETTAPINIGVANPGGGYNWLVQGAYLDDMKVTAAARYTSDFGMYNTVALPYDPYFNNVTLMLHGEGVLNGTVFTDSSPTIKTVTYSGTPYTTTSQYKYGGSSIYFNGASSYLSIANNAGFTFGSGDFTVELFIKVNATTGSPQQVLGVWHNVLGWAWQINMDVNRYIAFTCNTNISVAATAPLTSYGVWYHIAAVRSSGSIMLFLDGVLQSTTALAASVTASTSPLVIGSVAGPTTWYFNGWMDEIRITKGTARYTSNFVPPTGAFIDAGPPDTVDPYFSSVSLLLHADGSEGSSTFTDSSATPKVVTQRPSALGLGTGVSVSGVYARDMIFANGKFVAVRSGAAYVSTNGTTWTWYAHGLFGANEAYGVAYGAGVYVTLGGNTALAGTSPDGAVWTGRTLPVSAGWTKVAYGNGTFLAVSSSTIGATSANGIDWVQHNVPVAFTGIEFGNGIFVGAPISGRTVYTSTDGINWSTRSNVLGTEFSTQYVVRVVYGGGRFVLATRYASGTTSYTASSADGVLWVTSALPYYQYWDSLTYAGEFWIAATYASTVTAISYNGGIYWHPGPALHAVGGAWYCGAYGNGVAVIGNLNASYYEVFPVQTTRSTISNSIGRFNRSAITLKGFNDGLTVTPSTAFNFGSNNFTIEFFARAVVLSGRLIVLFQKNWDDIALTYNWLIGINQSGFYFYCSTDGTGATTVNAAKSATIATNVWMHYAVVRNGNAITCYIDGVGGTALTFAGSIFGDSTNLIIGTDATTLWGGNDMANAYLDEIRITNAARYTANFTPPTAPGPNA